MTYNNFIVDLNKHYYDLWDIGLKKQANISLKKYLQNFNANIDEETRFNIWYEFCEKCFMKSKYKETGIPYLIRQNILNFLNRFPDNFQQIKWLYLLTRDRDILEKAFNNKECDREIINYKFKNYIGDLDWATHHASEGLILFEENVIQEIIRNGFLFIEKYEISSKLQNSFHHYVKLYELLVLFQKNDGINFSGFCKEQEFKFKGIKTIYYTK